MKKRPLAVEQWWKKYSEILLYDISVKRIFKKSQNLSSSTGLISGVKSAHIFSLSKSSNILTRNSPAF